MPEVAPEMSANGGQGFMHWFQMGFAFTLPLIVFGFVALFIFLWLAQRGQ
jgi:hypothetical protein